MAKLSTYIARLKTALQAIGTDIKALRTNKEDKSNKATNLNSPNNTEYPTTKAVADALDGVEGGEVVKEGSVYMFKNRIPDSISGSSIIFSTSANINQETVGQDSVLIGKSIKSLGAQGYFVAIGSEVEVNDQAVAIGYSAKGGGARSVSLGVRSESLGQNGVAIGRSSKANGTSSTSVGISTESNGGYDAAIGDNAKSNGYMGTAVGRQSLADKDQSTAVGRESKAMGNASTALGNESQAYSYNEVNIGSFPTEYTPNSTTGNNNSDRAVNISGGTSENNRKDYLTILKSGLAFLPEQTIALIQDNLKAIITREYLEAELEKVRSKTILKTANFLIDDSLNNAVVISENVTMTVNAASMEGWNDEFKTAITNDGNNRAVLSLQGSKTYRVNDNPITNTNANFYIPTGGTITIIRKAKNSYLVKGDIEPADTENS